MVARTRPATLADLDATPDDGRIYELLDGKASYRRGRHPGIRRRFRHSIASSIAGSASMI